MLIKANGPVKLIQQLKCYTYKAMKSKKQTKKQKKYNEYFLRVFY